MKANGSIFTQWVCFNYNFKMWLIRWHWDYYSKQDCLSCILNLHPEQF